MKEKELEDMLSALRLIEGVDWSLVEQTSTALQKRIAAARDRIDGRKAAGKRRAQKNAKRRRAREWKKKAKVKLLEGIPEQGWWPYLKERHGSEWHISREQWDECVELCLDGEWIGLRRYNAKAPYTLDNIYVIDSETNTVLWDGKEQVGRDNGWFL